MKILTLNAGSSTLKYKLFELPRGKDGAAAEDVLEEGSEDFDPGQGIVDAAGKVITDCGKQGLDAIGHRVVHGGDKFTLPTKITPEVMQDLQGLRDLDPLHNPTETAMIDAGLRLLPNVPAVAVFDTGFHHTLPETAWRYALPRDLSDRLHLRRYGFHGISHQYVSGSLLQCIGRDPVGTRLIVCHLGSGASVCAVKDGKSVDTSMGMTPLEGLVMGTRSGDVDPGLLLYVLRSSGMTVRQLDDLLNHRSGMLGISGLSGDARKLEQAALAGDATAEITLELFAYRVCKYIGAYAAAMGGVDAVAFTGGIGENSADIRGRICSNLSFLGLQLSDERNNQTAKKEPKCISREDATVQAWVIPTNEELQIARETHALLVNSPTGQQ